MPRQGLSEAKLNLQIRDRDFWERPEKDGIQGRETLTSRTRFICTKMKTKQNPERSVGGWEGADELEIGVGANSTEPLIEVLMRTPSLLWIQDLEYI